MQQYTPEAVEKQGGDALRHRNERKLIFARFFL